VARARGGSSRRLPIAKFAKFFGQIPMRACQRCAARIVAKRPENRERL
jgi:hypothetical protein